MKSLSSDTHPEIAHIQVQLLSQAGPGRRFDLMRSLSQSTIEMSRRALQKRHSDLSQEELALKWIALCYGDDLAGRVGVYLESR